MKNVLKIEKNEYFNYDKEENVFDNVQALQEKS